MKGKGDLPIYSWTDTLDDLHYVVCSRCYVIKRACIYGLSTFLIVEKAKVPRWDTGRWRQMGKAKLEDELRKQGCLPFVCSAYQGHLVGLA